MITVVYATSEKFAPVLSVSIASLLDNRSAGTEYQVVVLLEKALPPEKRVLFSNLENRYSDFSLKWIELHGQFSRTKADSAGVGKESNYRLLIAELLPEVDRCIYLDADTLVLQDLGEMAAFDLSDVYLAGLHPRYFLHQATADYTKPHFEKYAQMIEKRAGGLKYDQYIGAGVMVMNLALLRAEHMQAEFLREIPSYSGPLDQDILNACCYGKIRELPLKYCIDLHDAEAPAWYQTQFPALYDQMQSAMDRPCIIHFSDRYKPWRNMGLPFEKIWWRYAFSCGAAESLWDELCQRHSFSASHYENECRRIQQSLSYRVGRAITWLPRWVLGSKKK